MQQDDVKPVTDDELDALVAALEEEMAAMTPPDDAQPVSVHVPICTRTDDAQQAAKSKADVLKEWCEKLKNAARQHNQANWLLGDALLDGFDLGLLDDDNESRSLYHLAERVTGFDRQHLRDIASVAKRCPKELRRDDLSWSHHRNLVNALPDADEDTLKKWLQRAVDRDWSANTFKEEIRKGASLEEKRYKVIEVRLPADVYQLMSYQGSTVEEVAARWLIERVTAMQKAGDEYQKMVNAAYEEKMNEMRAAAKRDAERKVQAALEAAQKR